MIIPYW